MKLPRWLRARPAVVMAAGFLTLLATLAALAPWLPLPDPRSQSSERRLAPPLTAGHWLGCDDLGRDVLSRVIHGGRYSLTIGFVVVGLAFSAGMPLGLLAGYLGGWVDRVISSIVEILMTFPSILLALVGVAALGPSLESVMIAIGVSQIPHYARQARASAAATRGLDYVLASRAAGATPLAIAWRHVAPNVLPPVLVVATMGLGGAILDAAGMSFLGLSGDPNRPEWGSMLTANRERFLQAPWMVAPPGLAITGSVLSFNVLGDALRDYLDPRSRR